MNEKIIPSKKIHSLEDARKLAKKRLPKMFFDFVDGASGDEKLCELNSTALDQIRLEPKVLRNVEKRNLSKEFFKIKYDLPFGFAPMGMCNLTWPGADKMLAKESIVNNIPTCVSMASTTALEQMYEFTEGRSWLQLYIFQDEKFVMELLDRAEKTGYKTLVLTVDVPIQFRRAKDDKNGFTVPFKIGPKQFFDFATHPNWSISTLLYGIPKPMNYETSKSGNKFVRNESRGSTDWETFGEDDPFGDFELMFIMARNSFKFSEIPISYFPRKFGETKTNVLKHGAKLFKIMLKLHIDFKA